MLRIALVIFATSRKKKYNILRARFEPATYGFLYYPYSPPLYQLSYRRMYRCVPLNSPEYLVTCITFKW